MTLLSPEERLLARSETENKRSLMLRFPRTLCFWVFFGCLFLLSPLCQITVKAQPAPFRFFHLTEKDGLGTRYAPSIVEDKKRGFVWIGAKSGIWRYDGETVVKGYPKPDKNALSTDTYLAITLLLADSRGDVWFYDEKKCIRRLSPASGEVQSFYVRSAGRDSALHFPLTFYIGCMHEDRKGRIWANTASHGLLLLDEKKAGFVTVPISHTLDQPGNQSKIYEDAEGWFWFSNKMKPVRYNPETGEVWFDKNNPKQWPVFDLYGSVFFVDSRQKMWLAEFNNGYRYDLKTQKVERLPELSHASGFVEDSQGRIWFGRYYNNFLTCYDPRTDRFELFHPNENDPNGLHISDWIAYVHLDSRGLLWALDVANINAFDPACHQPFRLFKAEADGGTKSLPKGEVSDVFRASDGRYYVSYWMVNGGVVVLDSNFQVLEKWGWGEQKDVFHQKAGWNAIEDNEGKIWTAQQSGRISIYDPKTRRLRKIECPEFMGTSPFLAKKDRQGNLWWGLWRSKGITKWDFRTRKFTNYPLIPANQGLVYCIIEGGGFHFLAGHRNGHHQIRPEYGPVAGQFPAACC